MPEVDAKSQRTGWPKGSSSVVMKEEATTPTKVRRTTMEGSAGVPSSGGLTTPMFNRATAASLTLNRTVTL